MDPTLKDLIVEWIIVEYSGYQISFGDTRFDENDIYVGGWWAATISRDQEWVLCRDCIQKMNLSNLSTQSGTKIYPHDKEFFNHLRKCIDLWIKSLGLIYAPR